MWFPSICHKKLVGSPGPGTQPLSLRALHSSASPPCLAPPGPGSHLEHLPQGDLCLLPYSPILVWDSPASLHPLLRKDFSSSIFQKMPRTDPQPVASPHPSYQGLKLANLSLPSRVEGLIWWPSTWGTAWDLPKSPGSAQWVLSLTKNG